MTDQKTAIVTGGSRGIGRAISLELAADGYYVIVNYRSNDAAAKKTLELIESNNGAGEIIKFDVGDSRQTQECVKDIISRCGNIEVLVNNAGITADGLFLMSKEEDWDSLINISIKGFYNITKPILKKMIPKHRGSIISMSSVSALTGNRGQANYSAVKAAIVGASKSIASEVGRLGIRVNVVAPGLIDTEMITEAPVDIIKQMIPMNRLGKPEEVAKLVRFLCSDDASYITGQVISINGGMF
ncbi:MAG: 3-oxoacyl-ACP reductase FabG [Spirochaetes bacterium]|nr:3-oxoacyl-ACP reductase FabG [Spirochaetota bacterium]